MGTLAPAMLALALILASATPAAAQALFSAPGDVQFVPTEVPDGTGKLVGLDAAGRAGYLQAGTPPRLVVVSPGGAEVGVALPREQIIAGMSWDLDAFLIISRKEQPDPVWRVYRIPGDTPAGPAPPPILEASASDLPALAGQISSTLGALRGQPDDSVCLSLSTGLVCFAEGAGATLRLGPEALDAQVPLRADWYSPILSPAADPPSAEQWRFDQTTPLPDGRVAIAVSKEWRGYRSSPNTPETSAEALAILAVDAAGAIEIVFGPVPQGGNGGWHPLQRAGQLAYDAELNAIAVVVNNWDIGWGSRNATGGAWIGAGLRLFPLDQAGTGYLSLTEAIQVQGPPELNEDFQPYGPAQLEIFPDPGGWLVRAIWRASAVDTQILFGHLERDLDTVDLDSDTLTAAEEAQHGTSDWLRDSDGGGTLDGIETKLDQTSPRDWTDDAAIARGAVTEDWFVDSPLIRLRLPDVSAFRFPRTWGPDGPLCADGVCYAPDGAEVVHYPTSSPLGEAAVAADGRSIVRLSETGVHRTWFDDGRGEQALDRAAIEPLTGAWGPRVRPIPIDRERLFLFVAETASAPPKLMRCTRGACEVAFDPAAARRDSGLGALEDHQSAKMRRHDVYVSQLSPVGWDAHHERLVLQIAGTLDAWLVAVGFEGPPTVVERAHTWVGANLDDYALIPNLAPPPATMPDWTVRTAAGDYFGPKGLVTASRQFLPVGFSMLPHLHEPSTTAWGDTLLSAICCGNYEDGLYETVRYRREVNPGDALVLRQVSIPISNEGDSYRYQLYRSGPRGGLMPLWDELNADIEDATGMDVSAHGELCIADAGKGVLWLFDPIDAPSRVPDVVVDAPAVPGIRDCLLDPDRPGDVLILADDPPRLLRRDGQTAEIRQISAETVINEAPRTLERRPDGSLTVTGQEVRGRTWLPDGREVTIPRGTFEVHIDGEPVATLPLVHIGLPDPASETAEADAELALRPDGLLIVAASGAPRRGSSAVQTYLQVVDLETGATEKLGILRLFAHGGGALAIMPGGLPLDPWTHAPLSADATPGTSDQPPPPPTGGNPMPVEEGCSSVPGAPPLLLLLLVRPARRRARSGRGHQTELGVHSA